MSSTTTAQQRIGRFTIVKRLGRGTQGAVFLARDPDLDRLVALKLVNEIPELQSGEGAASAQARNLAQLRHPNIVALYESGRFHNFSYLVFEYLAGKALREELDERGAYSLPEALSIVAQVVDAMAYAHAKDILHLDLNPNNVMSDEAGKPRIMDFDLSRNATDSASPGLIAGTVPYMAPEQFLAKPLDRRTDVFALGQILFECVTGKRAVPEGSRKDMAQWILQQEADVAPLDALEPSGALAQVYRRATARNPAQRFDSARDMHAALLAVLETHRAQADGKAAAVHGTVAFVLKRIERKGDFPAISRTLADVNAITRDVETASVSRLTNVVLRDVALTSRLLKLANSSYYSRGAGRIKTVSDAISLLGVDQVRLTCNGLACFGHFAGRAEGRRLREESISAFLAGLLARHLCARLGAKTAEEAFLAGMLFHLGRMLTMYHFPDDFADIEALVEGGATQDEATRSVLGITLPEIGRAVGEVWALPPVVLECMSPAVRTQGAAPGSTASLVHLANELVAVDARPEDDPAILLERATALGVPHGMSGPDIHVLLSAAVEKFRAFAPALEVNSGDSETLQRLARWVEKAALALPGAEPAAAPRSEAAA